MADGDRLAHSVMDDQIVYPGLATDYANMIAAALDLFALAGDHRYLDRARRWFAAADRHHFVPESGVYRLSADDAEALFATPYSVADEATPSATGIMGQNAARLFMLTSDQSYLSRADSVLSRLAARIEKDVVGSASLQAACDGLLRGRLAFLVGARNDPLALAAFDEADPAFTIVFSDLDNVPSRHPAHGKRPNRIPAAFLCDATQCFPEINKESELRITLQNTRRDFS
jgi:uncharacterized protein YyaL (SSP411 family)